MLLNHKNAQRVIILHAILVLLLAEITPLWVLIICFTCYLFKFFKQSTTSFILKLASISSLIAIIAYYRTLFDPEAAVSFLALISSFKILELNTRRDFVISFLIAFLLIGTQALFFNSLFYFILMLLGIILTFSLWWQLEYRLPTLSLGLKRTLSGMTLMLPFSLALFFLFPRYSTHFLSLATTDKMAKVGFSEKISNTNVEALSLSSKIAFRANFKSSAPSTKDLYWRGVHHFRTDGFNWEQSYDIASGIQRDLESENSTYYYQIYLEQNFDGVLFLLNNPSYFSYRGLNKSFSSDLHLARVSKFLKINNYSARSQFKSIMARDQDLNRYLSYPKSVSLKMIDLSRSLTLGITDNEKKMTALLDYFINNNFHYTLAPGKISSLDDFIFSKKKGFCTHYASALAIMARINHIPTRLISGFQGGEWNEFGEYFIIRDNDAHTWVEYLVDGQWRMIDPTAFIAPERIEFGGQQFLENYDSINFKFRGIKSNRFFGQTFGKTQLYLDNLNYRWSVFMDSIDRDFQQRLANLMQIKLNKLYLYSIFIILGLPALISFLYRLFGQYDFSSFKLDRRTRLLSRTRKFLLERGYGPNMGTERMFSLEADERARSIIQLFEKIKYSADENKGEYIHQLSTLLKKIS
jgi:transglutaminase-like putative cysteine protease